MGSVTRSDGLDYWRNKLFANIIFYLFPLGLTVLIASAFVVYSLNIWFLTIAYIAFGLVITIIALFRGLKITHRKYLFMTLIYSVATILIFFMGELGAGLTYLFGATVFSLLILPAKAGVLTIFINIFICLIQAAFIHNQLVDYPLRESHQVASWLAISVNSILLSIVAVVFMPKLFSGLQETIEVQKDLKQNLLNHQDELENSLKEKNILLAEIHHRVKNNLAVISGMLQIQSFKETDDRIQKKLLDSTLRIKSMANIHEQLYQSNSFSNMDFDSGLRNLVHTILETLDNHSKIEPEFNIEPINLNINQAVPCCLIVNEVLTNSIKHAFTDKQSGLISINLHKNRQHITLKIMDNGVGFTENTEQQNQDSLGMVLIQTLAQQLEAEYEYRSRESENGVLFNLTFKLIDISDDHLS
ncbi:histidine kinase dimerization/phosphoacceptor domain -containing protein [Gracilimonas sp.]|uniref:sensor histidine kinase n=1 Tax=Gracilimonas sp. TaxID=1974203 RepID=UPI0032EF6D66